MGWPFRFRGVLLRFWRSIVITIAIVGIVGVVASSPFLLLPLSNELDSWDRLSAMGQAYGAISAVLSALALAAVAVSLLVQRRQAEVAQEYAMHQQRLDIS